MYAFFLFPDRYFCSVCSVFFVNNIPDQKNSDRIGCNFPGLYNYDDPDVVSKKVRKREIELGRNEEANSLKNMQKMGNRKSVGGNTRPRIFV